MTTLSDAKLVGQGNMKALNKSVRLVGGSVVNPKQEVLATISSGADKNHWVNVSKIIASDRLSLYGGEVSFRPSSIWYWNPATGNIESSSYIVFYKIYKF